ncbi:hypothetical protein THMIRHAT_20690 [Thiosulfativibrio zosterae]|uniref:Uncharacterized protein n=1 Tax=Thiosulfativibrio zosterae TaxID=2675053 RepID=A0A6F8PQC3_9GAMM|nr:hypothetical protein THMIRHAT_20690 [Thiosulfativibrio zosterae]
MGLTHNLGYDPEDFAQSTSVVYLQRQAKACAPASPVTGELRNLAESLHPKNDKINHLSKLVTFAYTLDLLIARDLCTSEVRGKIEIKFA